MKRKLLATLLAVTTLVSMTACGGSDAPAESKADAPAESKVEAPAESKADAPAEAPAEKQDVALRMWGAEEDQQMLHRTGGRYASGGRYNGVR